LEPPIDTNGPVSQNFDANSRSIRQQQQSLEEIYSKSPSEPNASRFSSYPLHEHTLSGDSSKLPTWLRIHVSDVEKTDKMELLKRTLESNPEYMYSPSSVNEVLQAIELSSRGNRETIYGAADFCLMLVETMEMDRDTLIAAAWHYSECVYARKHCARFDERGFSHLSYVLDYWDTAKEKQVNAEADSMSNTSTFTTSAFQAISSFAEHASQSPEVSRLIQDCATLKRAEMVAAKSKPLDSMMPSSSESASIRKMLLSETHDWRALAIRSTACLYRLLGIFRYHDDKMRSGQTKRFVLSPKEIRVAREALSIHAPLVSRLGMHRLKNEIEGAAFRILYHRQHAKVSDLRQESIPCRLSTPCTISTLNDGMDIVLNKVANQVKYLLEQDDYFSSIVDTVKVSARTKEPYSLWRKMLKLNAKSILDVHDALALRVVLKSKKLTPDEDEQLTEARDRALCYYVLQQCVKIFKPVGDGRFKDYIANPKVNGYQSLHSSVSTMYENSEWPFEIQVRSCAMHQVAEFGLASHWEYKENQNLKKIQQKKPAHYAFKIDSSSDAYLRSIADWHWEQKQGTWQPCETSVNSEQQRANKANLTPYVNALMEDRSNLARDHVFVFFHTEESKAGHVLELPAGACVLDALNESERMFGIKQPRTPTHIVHNGSVTTFTRRLRNGDVLSVPISVKDNTSPTAILS
jgi:ppGpp synthetase/RelA/SpoT-type nucleotidyltranferase